MAILINSKLFSFTGKLGNVVGYTRNGRYYVRRVPKKSTKAPTPLQLATRTKFALASAHLSPIKDVLRLGFIEPRKSKMNYYNLAMKAFLTDAIVGEYPAYTVDYSKMRMSNGWLMGLLKLGMTFSIDLTICWASDFNLWTSGADDAVVFVAYNETTRAYVVDYTATRADGSLRIAIRANAGDVLHAWVFCVQREGRKVSNSQYVGSVSNRLYEGHV